MRFIPYVFALAVTILVGSAYLLFPNVETRTVTELVTLNERPTNREVRRVLADVRWHGTGTQLVAGYPFRCSTWVNTGRLGGEPENASRVKTALIACYRISQDEFVEGLSG